jgi:hypothetical protein
MEAWWTDPQSDTGVAKAAEEEHELRVDKAGLLMEAAEADRPPLAVIDRGSIGQRNQAVPASRSSGRAA